MSSLSVQIQTHHFFQLSTKNFFFKSNIPSRTKFFKVCIAHQYSLSLSPFTPSIPLHPFLYYPPPPPACSLPLSPKIKYDLSACSVGPHLYTNSQKYITEMYQSTCIHDLNAMTWSQNCSHQQKPYTEWQSMRVMLQTPTQYRHTYSVCDASVCIKVDTNCLKCGVGWQVVRCGKPLFPGPSLPCYLQVMNKHYQICNTVQV